MDTSKVTDMDDMFFGADAMTHPKPSLKAAGEEKEAAAAPQPKTKEELKDWIKECDSGVKNHGEPNTWDVTLVTDMSALFENMVNFNAPIDQWNTSNVTTMFGMLAEASSFNQPITMDTSQVTNMRLMFMVPRRLINRLRWIRQK